jgi:hypothetical protein
VAQAAPDFFLLRQALTELRQDVCDGSAARHYLEQFPSMIIRMRCLARPSPFAECWTQEQAGPADWVTDPARALERLHSELTPNLRA